MSRQSSGENAIHSAHAAVYNFDTESNSWVSVDGGVSRVFVFNNPEIFTFRVIGISGADKYVINSPIFKGLVHQIVSEVFVQWRDSTAIYGLSFSSGEDATAFSQVLTDCVRQVTEAAAAGETPKRAPPPPARKGPGPTPRSVNTENTFDLISTDSSELEQKDRVVKEIFTTEKDYVEKLETLVNHCLEAVKPPKGKYRGVFSDPERKLIYGNVEILLHMNLKFLQDLSQRLVHWHKEQTIGDIFVQIIPFFRVYKEYFNNYEAGVALLDKLAKRKDVGAYLKYCENVTDGHKLPYLLIMPVQRIPRYTLLLTELIKYTPPDHPDLEKLTAARDELKKFTMVANESVRETEHSKKFMETLKDPKKYIGFEAIVAPHRSLVYECDLSVRLSDKEFTWMLIFSDLLVFASTTGKKRTVEEKLPLEQVWFEDLGVQDKFRIITPEKMYLAEPNSRKPLDKARCIAIFEKSVVALLTSRNLPHEENGNRRTFAAEYAGGRYDGEWYYAKPSGRGTMTYARGNLYTGEFEAGRLSGVGRMQYRDSGSVYEGCWQADRPHGEGQLITPAGSYTGLFVNGVKHGPGTMVWLNGDRYEGDWLQDRMSGKGTFTSNAASYQGQWENNLFHGWGTLEWPGGRYEGDWVHDRRSGEGTHIRPNGDSYTGQWKENQHHGQGTFRSVDGTYVYEGEWDCNRMNGKGNLTCEKFTYTGSWKDDRKSGYGVLVDRDGTSYDGHWADDRREGQGVYKAPTGEVYDGHWHSDKRFGKGKLILPDGSSYDGEWINNRKEGKGTFTWVDGTKYSGNWMSDKRHGKGVLTAADESYKYAGEWANDYRHGKGILSLETGTHEGEWKEDKPHGPGKHISKNRDIIDGVWKDGLLDGEATLTLADGSAVMSLFYKDSNRERPNADILPPSQPPIKLIAP